MLRLAFFGDDFTGSTDALEQLALAGLRSRLFLDPPDAARCAGLDAVGVAGLTRALGPDDLARALRPALAALRTLGAPHVHYKVCSTFDSSPDVGSIGRALEVGADLFRAPFVPVVAGTPALGRYCAFGQLFARYGIGSQGAIHRLDRHPAISRHPVTPMTEADLRVHLARQTSRRLGLLSVLELDRAPADRAAALAALVADGNDAVLFDALHADHVQRIGELLDAHASAARPLFTIGPSSVETALAAPGPTPALPAVVTALRAGRPALVYTSKGEAAAPVAASILGTLLGEFTRAVLAQVPVARVVVAGGDTSSYAARALGIESITAAARLTPGAPLCQVSAPRSPADGLEFVFKGGQVGAPDFFAAAQPGTLS